MSLSSHCVPAGLRNTRESLQENAILSNPALPEDVLEEAVPGNIRKAEHFVMFLSTLVEYLKV